MVTTATESTYTADILFSLEQFSGRQQLQLFKNVIISGTHNDI